MRGQRLRLNFRKERLNFILLFLAIHLFTNLLVGQKLDSTLVRVVNPDGIPMQNVTIHSQDFHFLVETDKKGKVYIASGLKYDTLCFTSIGYRFQQASLEHIVASSTFEMVLRPFMENLEEVIVVGRTDAEERSMDYVTERITSDQVGLTQSQTSADVLQQHTGIFLQKSQMGGGSPVIRGFEASRVLLVVDGVRMNNAIYRSGHLQNAITIDPNALAQAEVIYGPGSLLYGSDALGGVIHYRTKEPQLQWEPQKSVTSLHAGLTYSSANREKKAHIDYNLGSSKLAFFGSFTYTDFDHLRSGKNYNARYPDFGKRLYYVNASGLEDQIVKNPDPHIQIGSGYHQVDLVQKIKWKPTENYIQTLNFQFSTSSDIPRYDQLTEENSGPEDLKFAEWHYGPQDRLFFASKNQLLKSNAIFDKGLIIGSYQKIGEDRISRRFGRETRVHQEEHIEVYSLTADFEKKGSEKGTWKLLYGLEANWNDLESEAFNTLRNGSGRQPELTRYPDDRNTMGTYGAYANIKLQTNEIWDGNVGARISHIHTYFRYTGGGLVDWPNAYLEGVRNKNTAITWAASINYRPTPNWHLRTHIGTAFRAPNIDDLAKIRIKSGEATAPNPDLKPESSFHSEITVSRLFPSEKGTGFYVSFTGYYTYLKDAIIQVPFSLPNNDTLLLFDDVWYRVVGNANEDNGKIWGVSGNLAVPLHDQWEIRSSLSYTRGRTESAEGVIEPMAHIPPLHGKTSISYHNDRLKISAVIRYNGAKPLKDYSSNSADNLEKATPIGTLAWVTFNLYSRYKINDLLMLHASIENVTDLHYRPFASGISAPGRNFILGLSMSI
jgi:hemoglobin/transferrin/lactoferrin receptor protein